MSDAADAPSPQSPPPILDPDSARKILTADLKNLLGKVQSGKPLSGPQRQLIASLAGGNAPDAGTEPATTRVGCRCGLFHLGCPLSVLASSMSTRTSSRFPPSHDAVRKLRPEYVAAPDCLARSVISAISGCCLGWRGLGFTMPHSGDGTASRQVQKCRQCPHLDGWGEPLAGCSA